MPIKSKRARSRARQIEGLPEDAYTFFTDGPFFSGEAFERRTTEATREGLWRKHREEIIRRYTVDCPPGTDPRTWGEIIFEGAGDEP